MKIHKQGYLTVALAGILLAIAISFVMLFIKPVWLLIPLVIIFISIFLLILWFFRVPARIFKTADQLIYAPADGKVVVIEETYEDEYFKDERKQVSIFMSPLNIHVNYYPIGGTIDYVKYHHGKYLVAWHPKSSTENERSTVVVKKGETRILIRQIAGALARRIVTNSAVNQEVKQCEELGFIKFGSRVDLFLPKTAKVVVKLNEVTRAGQTVIATM